MKQGKFITLEGGEGAGKSTQARYISSFLETKGVPCLLTREPGGTPGAEAVRNLLVRGDKGSWDAVGEYLLFSAARRDHLAKRIIPALEEGIWVVCDRFYDSSKAYQGGGHGLDVLFMDAVHEVVSGGLCPDLTFIFDIPPTQGLGRTEERKNGDKRFEEMGLSFHERVRQSFLDIADSDPVRCRIIDASHQIEEVTKNIIWHIEARFFGRDI